MRHCLIIAFLLVIVMTSCNRNKDVVENVHALPEIYPDYRGVTVPWNIAPLNFCMTDDEYSSMEVWVKGSLKDEMVCEGDYADFDIDEWHRLLNDNKGGKVNVSVSAQKNRKWMTFLPFDIYISAIPINEWGITYRLVAPGYEIYGKQGIFQRCLSDFSESAIYQTTEVTGTCVNCHTPNATNPDDFVMHIRGEKGTTLIRHNGKDDYMKSRNDSLGGPMVFPSWHPTGKYIAFSTNETQQIFHSRAKKRIEYFDVKSDIFIYNPETHTALVDPRLATKEQMENCPVFAPDGQSIYFITATYRDPKRRVFKTDVKNLHIFCL